MAADALTMLDRERSAGRCPARRKRSPAASAVRAVDGRRSWWPSWPASASACSASLGVSLGLGAATIMSRGTLAQKERWLPGLVTLEKVARLGDHRARRRLGCVRRHEDLRPAATARTTSSTGRRRSSPTVRTRTSSSSTRSSTRATRPSTSATVRCSTFVLDAGMPGLTQGKPFKKMGMMSSPTGELFFDNVRLTRDRLLGETEQHAAVTAATARGPTSSPSGSASRRCRWASSTSVTGSASTTPRPARCGVRRSGSSS